jgi:hypothetical protein
METMEAGLIDVSRSVGRRLGNKKHIETNYPFIAKSEKTYTLEEVFTGAEKVVNDYFGSNLKLQNL